MYMSDINTTLSGKKKKAEDPKKASVITKKIFSGLFAIILAVGVFTISSWQLPVIFDTVNCMKNSKKPCPYPANENAPPYNSKNGTYDMDPLQALLNILYSVIAGFAVGITKPQCCNGQSGGGPPSKIQRSDGNILTKFNLQIGGTGWKPFDIYSSNIGWPYDEVKKDATFGFNYWLGASQIKSWVIPRQLIQCMFLFSANLMDPKIGPTAAWFTRFVITVSLPFIFIGMLFMSGLVSVIATIWGGFLQHIFAGNLAGCIWGFFCTWALIIFNLVVQPIELLGSFFLIPTISNGTEWVQHNWDKKSMGGYREIVLGMSFVSFIAVVLASFAPLLSQ